MTFSALIVKLYCKLYYRLKLYQLLNKIKFCRVSNNDITCGVLLIYLTKITSTVFLLKRWTFDFSFAFLSLLWARDRFYCACINRKGCVYKLYGGHWKTEWHKTKITFTNTFFKFFIILFGNIILMDFFQYYVWKTSLKWPPFWKWTS